MSAMTLPRQDLVCDLQSALHLDQSDLSQDNVDPMSARLRFEMMTLCFRANTSRFAGDPSRRGAGVSFQLQAWSCLAVSLRHMICSARKTDPSTT
jgi:hypothetical protein